MMMNIFKRRIYLDNSATTKTHPDVIRKMIRYMKHRYANPSSVHNSGIVAKASVELARESIAKHLDCDSEQLVFTGSGSEANNMAIKGILGQDLEGAHVITSMIEHSSILNTILALEARGIQVSYVDVDRYGRYDLEHLERLIGANTKMIALSLVNSEIGTIQDMQGISEIAGKYEVHLHMDMVQALPYLDIDLKAMGVDTASFSGHKIEAPKGIGVLYAMNPKKLGALIHGGDQENGMRGGTENVPYIMGMAEAVAINKRTKVRRREAVRRLQEAVIEGVKNGIEDVMLTGDPIHRSPHHASFVFKDVDGKLLVDRLSEEGFETSSGTACSSKRKGPSKVIESCGIDSSYSLGSLRISVSPRNTLHDIKRFVKVLKKQIEVLRKETMDGTSDIGFISQKELEAMYQKGDAFQLLNVSPRRADKDAYPDLIFAPFWSIDRAAKQLDPNIPTVVACQHGDILAPKAAKFLSASGFVNVYVLQGGLFAMQD